MVRRTSTTTTTTTTTTANPNPQFPPKKKKGRPSLFDLQQRKLLQQNPNFNSNSNSNSQLQSSSNPNLNLNNRRPRSTRRIPNLPAHFIDGSDSDDDDDHHHHSIPNSPHSLKNNDVDDDDNDDDVDDDGDGDDDDGDGDDGDDDERAQKKVKLVVQFPNSKLNNVVRQVDKKGSKATDNEKNGTRRVIGGGPTVSTSTATATPTTTTTTTTSAAGTRRSTPLPDKKLLLLILDRLQKKDTRGVFAEPVDPEELPDYHDIIENPMDFDTVRKKLLGGVYVKLDQLEDDINLICSNAMQYNAPSTVFFRQARAIQELAKKEFETLRQDGGLSELPMKPRRGRPPGSRNLKKLLEKSSPPERTVRESSSDATPASREEDPTKSANYNLRKGPSLYRFPRAFDNCFDLSASSSKSMSAKYGKRPCGSDDIRRETYYLSGDSHSGRDMQSFSSFGGPERQLIPVGLASDHSYARSLAKFAKDLGPNVWRIASKKITSALPPGVEFGPGWVGENDTKLVQSNSVSQDYSKSEQHIPSTSGYVNSSFSSKPPTSCAEKLVDARESSSNAAWSSHLKSGNDGVVRPSSSLQIQHQGSAYPRMNGLSDGFGSGPQFQEAMARPSSSTTMLNPHALDSGSDDASRSLHGVMNSENDIVTHGMPYWQNLSMQERWDRPYPVELNGGFQASGSKSSNLPIGSPPQLDLVLQL